MAALDSEGWGGNVVQTRHNGPWHVFYLGAALCGQGGEQYAGIKHADEMTDSDRPCGQYACATRLNKRKAS